MDPEAVFKVCGWRPVQPYWVPVPYLRGGFAGIMEAVRVPGDGERCPTYEFAGFRARVATPEETRAAGVGCGGTVTELAPSPSLVTRLDRIRGELQTKDGAWLVETADMARFLATLVMKGAPAKGPAKVFLARLEEPDA